MLAETGSGRALGTARIDGWIAAPRDTVAVVQVNRPVSAGAATAGATLFTDWFGTDLAGGGLDVLAEQPGARPEFGERRHPRTAVGWNGRSLFWVVVDGRQAPISDGMTLAELAALFERLGARHAVNLDGGGSTAMVVRGRVVNRPSDATGERPVGNALLLERCEPDRRPWPGGNGRAGRAERSR